MFAKFQLSPIIQCVSRTTHPQSSYLLEIEIMDCYDICLFTCVPIFSFSPYVEYINCSCTLNRYLDDGVVLNIMKRLRFFNFRMLKVLDWSHLWCHISSSWNRVKISWMFCGDPTSFGWDIELCLICDKLKQTHRNMDRQRYRHSSNSCYGKNLKYDITFHI